MSAMRNGPTVSGEAASVLELKLPGNESGASQHTARKAVAS